VLVVVVVEPTIAVLLVRVQMVAEMGLLDMVLVLMQLQILVLVEVALVVAVIMHIPHMLEEMAVLEL
jgi:hypothetical protein